MEIKLLTYNIFMRPLGVKNNSDDFKSERLSQIIKTVLPAYDIICFQESFDCFTFRKQRLLSEAQKQGFEFFVSSSNPGLFTPQLVDGGLLVLSRFPIVDSEFT